MPILPSAIDAQNRIFLLSSVSKSSFALCILTEPLLQALPIAMQDKTGKKKGAHALNEILCG